MNVYVVTLVIFVTALVTMLGTAWWTGRGCVATEQPRERKRSGGNENADRWLPRAGRLAPCCPMCGESWGHPHDPRCARLREFAGAADPAQQLPAFDPLKVLADALTIAERQVERDAISRQVDAIMLEVELDPRWRYR